MAAGLRVFNLLIGGHDTLFHGLRGRCANFSLLLWNTSQLSHTNVKWYSAASATHANDEDTEEWSRFTNELGKENT